MSQNKLVLLKGYGISCMQLIFNVEMFIYQSKANLDVKILFGDITHLVDPEIRKFLERGLYGNQDSTFQFGA